MLNPNSPVTGSVGIIPLVSQLSLILWHLCVSSHFTCFLLFSFFSPRLLSLTPKSKTFNPLKPQSHLITTQPRHLIPLPPNHHQLPSSFLFWLVRSCQLPELFTSPLIRLPSSPLSFVLLPQSLLTSALIFRQACSCQPLVLSTLSSHFSPSQIMSSDLFLC